MGQPGKASTRAKRQTIPIFDEERNKGMALAPGGPQANHLSLASASTSTFGFLQATCASWCPSNRVKAPNATICPLQFHKNLPHFIYRVAILSKIKHTEKTYKINNNTSFTQMFYSSTDFVWDNPGEPVPEETFTHSHLSWSSIIPYLHPPSIMINGILLVQFTCLTVFFYNLSSSFLWSGWVEVHPMDCWCICQHYLHFAQKTQKIAKVMEQHHTNG